MHKVVRIKVLTLSTVAELANNNYSRNYPGGLINKSSSFEITHGGSTQVIIRIKILSFVCLFFPISI